MLFSIWRRYKFESNSQQDIIVCNVSNCCFQYDEDTSSKAIHNSSFRRATSARLFSIWRRYKFESNSQLPIPLKIPFIVVFNMTKIQVRKQFTTRFIRLRLLWCCFQYDEDTSSKAIHNSINLTFQLSAVVFNMTKIQVRKQFTTYAAA